jgi:hypothetical protein
VPICTASRAYQRRKLVELEGAEMSETKREAERELVLARACICNDLAGSVTKPVGIDPDARAAVCCGPNTVYFSKTATLREMIDHIYGRAALPISSDRPHMFLKELSLHLDSLRKELDKRRRGLVKNCGKCDVKENLRAGVEHYRTLAAEVVMEHRHEFSAKLEELNKELERLVEATEMVGEAKA